MTRKQPFDQKRAEAYDERIRRLAPGYDVLHDLIASLLKRTLIKPNAKILIIGAGTGAEIIKLSQVEPEWSFTAVDPSEEMLTRCSANISQAGLSQRANFVCSRIEELSNKTFYDAATSIFVAHFITEQAHKRQFFRAIADLLCPQAPFVFADLYRTTSEFDFLTSIWQTHFARLGTPREEAEHTFAKIDKDISFVDEQTLQETLAGVGFAP
ncbi:MAG: class I SAM-dependent methyltransferase, partial [Bacteroidota bacterium]